MRDRHTTRVGTDKSRNTLYNPTIQPHYTIPLYNTTIHYLIPLYNKKQQHYNETGACDGLTHSKIIKRLS